MTNIYQNDVNINFNVQDTQGVKINVDDKRERLGENYTCKDQNWQTSTYSGNIYISTPNNTHSEILKHHENPDYKIPENGYPGTSGFFTNENTASKHFNQDASFDSVGLGHDLQQAPYYNSTMAYEAKLNNTQYNPEYNGNLDCFRVNKEKMLENYGTSDFYAAQSSCVKNTAWGEGGGFQGYNPHINEMINNGSLEYIPEKSRTCNNNECLDYSSRKAQAQQEASAVNEHIEKNNIKGEPGQRIGYNEVYQSNEKQDGTSVGDQKADGISSDNVASTGGGARAPNDENSSSSGICGEKPTPKSSSSTNNSSPQKCGEAPDQSATQAYNSSELNRMGENAKTAAPDNAQNNEVLKNPTDRTVTDEAQKATGKATEATTQAVENSVNELGEAVKNTTGIYI